MSEKYFDSDGRFAALDDEEEQIPAYAMIPAGGDAADVSGADDVYDAYDEDTHGAVDKTAVEYQADGLSVIQTGAYSSSPALQRAERVAYSVGADMDRNVNNKAGDVKTSSKEEAVKLIPATDDLKSSRIRLNGAWHFDLPDMSIEEDILVPDTQPDLEKILSITAVPEITRHESYAGQNGKTMLKINGSFDISVLYLPAGRDTAIAAINSKIPFRREFEISEQLHPQAEIRVTGEVPQAKVINERKIRISTGASFRAWKYGETEIELLEGVRDDSLLLKKECVRFTDMAQRRTDTTDIREKIRLKESYPEPESILHYDVNVVEEHRQIAKGKAVIEASLYYSILYMPVSDAASKEDQDGKGNDVGGAPVYVRGKTDFTQFLRLPDIKDDETAGSIIKFDILSSDISLRAPGARSKEYDEYEDDEDAEEEYDDNEPHFYLTATVSAGIQVYKSIERNVVTDMYHRTRNLEYSTAPYQLSELCGSASSDISVRETVSIPETRGSASDVPYIALEVENITASCENDRCTIEGSLIADILFIEEETLVISSFEHRIPFRTSMDMPGACADSYAECGASIKEIWFDRVNSRQIDINCSISAGVSAWNTAVHEFIDKVCYIDDGSAPHQFSGIVVYMTKPEDTQWSISKKFRTTEAALREVNGLDEGQDLSPGMRLIIV